jgi:hypothetical protein
MVGVTLDYSISIYTSAPAPLELAESFAHDVAHRSGYTLRKTAASPGGATNLDSSHPAYCDSHNGCAAHQVWALYTDLWLTVGTF